MCSRYTPGDGSNGFPLTSWTRPSSRTAATISTPSPRSRPNLLLPLFQGS
jgi:hypothetical protein